MIPRSKPVDLWISLEKLRNLQAGGAMQPGQRTRSNERQVCTRATSPVKQKDWGEDEPRERIDRLSMHTLEF